MNIRETIEMVEAMAKHPAKEEVIRSVAQQLGFDTLETRGRDQLDFHDVNVSAIKKALDAAYEWGRRAGAAGEQAQGTDEHSPNV